MLKRELAQALGISPAMVTKLVKRGMPADSLERAQRWRRRHLEPSRVKGVRFEPKRADRIDPVAHANALGALALDSFDQHGGDLEHALTLVPDARASELRISPDVWELLIGLDRWSVLWPHGEDEPPSEMGSWFLLGVALGRLDI